MIVEVLQIFGTDRDIANTARTTISLEDKEGRVPEGYMRKMYLCEHSPIRIKQILVSVTNIPYWIVMHFRTHKFGIEHWVSTQRDDRAGVPRHELPQTATVNWKFLVNSSELIYISRRRLCTQAHKETREAWIQILDAIGQKDPTLVSVCVPDCIYRGWCYEYKSCEYHKTKVFKIALDKYRKDINGYVPMTPKSPLDYLGKEPFILTGKDNPYDISEAEIENLRQRLLTQKEETAKRCLGEWGEPDAE